MNILIVGDYEENNLMKNMLLALGHNNIKILTSTEEVLNCLNKKQEEYNFPDVIFLDINMEEISTLKLPLKIRNIESNKIIPIIAIIDNANAHLLPRFFQEGINDYIKRPFSLEELEIRINIAKNSYLYNSNLVKEIDIAKHLQKSMLGLPIKRRNIEIDGVYIPSENLAGDLYCWFQIDAYKYGIITLDVMGHGISSALISMSLRSLLRGMITRLVNPEQVIFELNKHMNNLYTKKDEFSLYYFSAIYMVIDTKNKTVEYANAGHPPGIAILDETDVIRMKEGCIAIGLMPKITVEKGSFSYNKSLRVLLYTDGVFEAIREKPYDGIKKLEDYILENVNRDNDTILGNILPKNNNFFSFKDDICLVSIKA